MSTTRAAARTPFRASTALAAGELTRSTLRARHRRVLPDVWLAGRAAPTPVELARSAWCWSSGTGVLAGWSAAAVHGARWVPQPHPAELVVRTTPSAPHTLQPWRWVLDASEVETVDGMRVTTLSRTAYDLGRRLPLLDAVAAVDELLWMAVTDARAVERHVQLHTGARGTRNLRTVLALADPGAASPWESRTRVVLALAGLDGAATQVDVRGPDGTVVARVDLGWPRWRVAVEYEGDHHRARGQYQDDVRRRARISPAGWVVVPVTAGDLAGGATGLIAAVQAALRRAGAPVGR